MSIRKFYYTLPPEWRLHARRVIYSPIDLWDKITGRRDALQPPRRLIFTGSGNFVKQGQQFFEYFCQYGGLQPDHHVLDVGSGIGRMAIPLTRYLNEEGRYEGFDIVEAGVNWCRDHISSRYPNFHFQHVGLRNDLYRSEGRDPADFTFPYDDESFDFVILTSVFTHMLPNQVSNYLREIQRVLRPGGHVFATFFLLNEENQDRQEGIGNFQFPYDRGDYRLMDEHVESANVAFRESFLRDLIRRIRAEASGSGLKLQQIHHGYWGDRPKDGRLDFQDIVVLEKG